MNKENENKTIFLVQNAMGVVICGFFNENAAEKFCADANDEPYKSYAMKPYTTFPIEIQEEY